MESTQQVDENTKKKHDSMLVVHGAMSRDEFNRKWGKKKPAKHNPIAGPGGVYKNVTRSESVENVQESKWKITFVHQHPDGEKKHDYVVSAPHQNAADKKAIAAHSQAHPKGDFHMWNSEQIFEGLEDACWKGYEAIGMKMKNGKKVPNCVPKEEAQNEALAKVSVTRPIGHRIADIGPGGKEHNVQTKDWPGDHAAAAQTAHQAAHAALKQGDIETYHKEMDKKFAAHQAASAEAGKKPVKTFESSDEQKNLKITKHEKAAVEAEKRGDKHAQEYHLNIVKRLKQNESVNEATEPKMQRHLVTVTVVDPHHPMTSKRKEKIMKRAKVTAKDPKDAVAKAEAHYKKHGFKVHDSLHHSIVNESLDTDEFVDQYDSENENPASCHPNETAEKGVTENNDTPEAETEEEKAEQIQRLKLLIRLGFLELSQLPIAMRVIKRLEKGQTVAIEQEKEVLELMMEKLLGLVTGDEFMFRRSRQLVQK
jgi:hypothetical protein